MNGLIPDEQLKAERQEEPWKRSETDKMLDLYLAGNHPKSIAREMHRTPKSVKRRIEQFQCNERDRAIRYEPRRRVSRKGKRMTENESLLIQEHRSRKIPIAVTSKVVQRPVNEIDDSWKKKAAVLELKSFASGIDLVLALRYAFQVYKVSVVSDDDYDGMVKEEIEFGGGGPMFEKYRDARSAPKRIRSLALYLCERLDDKEKGVE